MTEPEYDFPSLRALSGLELAVLRMQVKRANTTDDPTDAAFVRAIDLELRRRERERPQDSR